MSNAAAHYDLPWKSALTLAHFGTQQAPHDAESLYAAKWQLTKLLYQHGWRKERIIVLFKVMNCMMALPQPYQERYWQAVLQLEKERKMEWISPLEQSFMDKGWEKGLKQGLERGLERGLEQGLEQGLEKGRKEGAALVLERQLAQRFGSLSQTTRKRLARANVEQLAAWSDALPEAQTLKQVFG